MSNSPFKFLESFNKEDKHIFFGREKETSQLYQLVLASPLVLVYGISGIGKTSLINCGLSNKFENTDWLPLFIRRNENIISSLDLAIQLAAETYISHVELDENGEETYVPFSQKIKQLFKEHFKPIFLIFDQFEELFIMGTKDEQHEFFSHLKEILDSDVQCRIILSMREEYIAQLSPYEQIIPHLFDNRLRLENMSRENLKLVLGNTIKAQAIDIKNEKTLLELMIDNISDQNHQVELTNLQIYLNRLYQEANKNVSPIYFDLALINKVGVLKSILSDFLKSQIDHIEKGLAKRGITQRGLPFDLLFELVTDKETKRSLEISYLQKQLQESYQIKNEDIEYCLDELKAARIIKEIG